MPTVTFSVFDGAGDAHTGDAHAISDGSVNLFNPIQNTGWVGRELKNADEVNSFFAFDMSTVPLGSRLDGVNFEFTTSAASDGSGDFKIGVLLKDDVWEVSGFTTSTTVSGGDPYYNKAFEFPNDGTALPHATQDSSTTIESGILFFNAWATGDIAFGSFSADTRFAIGSGIGGEDYSETSLTAVVSAVFNALNYDVVGLTMDSQDVGNAANRLRLYFTETSDPDDAPKLVVSYTLNPPAFTSTPVTEGTVDVEYTYDADADAYSLGDQTAGFFDDTEFSLVAPPSGMAIVSSTGVITWTPGASDYGANAITVRATNAGGQFVDQSFTLDVEANVGTAILAGNVVRRTSEAVGNVVRRTSEAASNVVRRASEAAGNVTRRTSEGAGNVVRRTSEDAGNVRQEDPS